MDQPRPIPGPDPAAALRHRPVTVPRAWDGVGAALRVAYDGPEDGAKREFDALLGRLD